MRSNIHPKYYPEAEVSCSCGNKFTVGSTREKLQIEICRSCHPFFSGQDKIIDTAGRVEKFKNRRTKSAVIDRVKKVKPPRQKKKSDGLDSFSRQS